jgi:Golgi nucleoside diphosphatase
VNDYNAAGPSLNGLVLFLKEQIPESQWSKSPIWLFATAGLRMLDTKDSTAILGSVQNYLSDKNNSPFLFHSDWARIISGIC